MSAINTEKEPRHGTDVALLAELESRFSPAGIRQRRYRRFRTIGWLVWVNTLAGTKRTSDLVGSSLLLIFFFPLLLALYTLNRLRGGAVERSPRLGRWGLPFERYSFSGGYAGQLPSLINVFLGHMSLVGPRPVAPGDVSPTERLAWKRFNARPGLLCLWWIRSRANIGYGTEVGSDVEYVDTQSFMGDLGIALRAVPAALYGEGVDEAPDYVSMLGIPINNVTMDEAVAGIVRLAKGSAVSQACFVNADCANIAWIDHGYREILKNCGMVLADGIGMKLAGRLLNRNIRQNVNGTDLLPQLCKILEKDGLGIFLLGGKPGVAEDVALWMRRDFPDLQVSGCEHGYFAAEKLPEILTKIRRSGARVLLVAFGVPKQERWISAHLEQTGAMVSMGVGGLFDFYSGRIPRAPAWVREMGMEWVYRLVQEPHRMWRRYVVGNVIFLSRVLRERVGMVNPL